MQPKAEPKKEPVYKILVIGDIGTGKTSLIKRYVHDIFSIHYKSTIGVDFASKLVKWDDTTTIHLQLWDIAGQERFGNMTRQYYKEAHGALIVFDTTRLQTLDAARKWKLDLDTKVTLPNSEEPIPAILLANKIDLFTPDETNLNWGRSEDDMNRFCDETGFATWVETTATTNHNGMEMACMRLTNLILSKIVDTPETDSKTDDVVDITPQPVNKAKCC